MHHACRCGRSHGRGSIRFELCDTCDHCGSTIVPVGEEYPEPKEHNWTTRYHPQTGTPYRRCITCGRREGWEEAKEL